MKIWQTWKSRDPKTFHPYYKFCHPSWQELHPDWDYELIDDNDILNFCKTYFPDVYDDFCNLPKQIYRVDLVRYMILFIKGGLYVDMDFLALKNHTPLWENAEINNTPIVFGKLNDTTNNHYIPNAWMMSVYSNEIFWLLMLEMGFKRCKENTKQVEACSGPTLLVDAFKIYNNHRGNISHLCPIFIKMCIRTKLRNSQIQLLDTDLIYPCDWRINNKLNDIQSWINTLSPLEIREKCPDSYAITFWSHNWD